MVNSAIFYARFLIFEMSLWWVNDRVFQGKTPSWRRIQTPPYQKDNLICSSPFANIPPSAAARDCRRRKFDWIGLFT